MQQLLQRCAANDMTAWKDFCQIVEGAALYPIKRLLRASNMDLSLADDILQEFYSLLLARTMSYLEHFHGTTEPEFRCFLRIIAWRFALKLIKKWQRSANREAMLRRQLFAQQLSRASDRPIDTCYGEFELAMSSTDRTKLEILSQLEGATGARATLSWKGVSPRTLRRWRRELYLKYAEKVFDLSSETIRCSADSEKVS